MINKIPKGFMKFKLPEDYTPIPQWRWGQDHWGTLAYIDFVCVDKGGEIDNLKMRCDPYVHEEMMNLAPFSREVLDGSKYPTKLKDDELAYHHDDWSCVEDMIHEELVEMYVSPLRRGAREVIVRLTQKGRELSARLRWAKMDGIRY